jgi:hypothetical protein
MAIPLPKGQFFCYSLAEGVEAKIRVVEGDPVELSYAFGGPFGEVAQTIDANGEATVTRPGMVRSTGESVVAIDYPTPEPPVPEPEPEPAPEVTP